MRDFYHFAPKRTRGAKTEINLEEDRLPGAVGFSGLDQTVKQVSPEHQGPSFEYLMMLVFSDPMCIECLDEESENEDTVFDEEEKREQS